MNQRQYIEYLIATTDNYTCTNLADHLEGEAAQSHDAICDFLSRARLPPSGLWQVTGKLIEDSPESFLIFDDSVQDKRYSSNIQLVKLQYSGAAHGLVRGIGVLNLLHSNGQGGEFYPVDYRVYAPDEDGKTKNDHFREMLVRAVSDKQLQAKTVLFDSWYASVDNLKLIERLHLNFVTTLKANRLVKVWKDKAPGQDRPKEEWVHLQDLKWTDDALEYGLLVKLKELPFAVRLFKIAAPNGGIDWLIAKGSHTGREEGQTPLTARGVQEKNAVRWHIEQLHREVKQLVGTARCQCRKARSQRNHLACCYLAWVCLKRYASQLQTTLYEAKHELLRAYLKSQLANPTIKYCFA